MSNNKENYLSLTQKYSILLLSANDNEPVTGKIWFQKELFLVAQNIPKLDDETEFEGSLMGPYSENRDKILHERCPIALSLLRKGKVTLQKAAELAGIKLEDFIQLAKTTVNVR